MLVRTTLLAGAAVLALALPALAAESEIGSVFEREFYGAQGTRGSEVKDLYFKDEVYEQEKVTTGPTGRTALQFLDATRIQVGPNSTVVLDKYVYDPAKGDPENGVPAGTPFENVPDDWVCPVCGASKQDFEKSSD